jgi:hypothetical protein
MSVIRPHPPEAARSVYSHLALRFGIVRVRQYKLRSMVDEHGTRRAQGLVRWSAGAATLPSALSGTVSNAVFIVSNAVWIVSNTICMSQMAVFRPLGPLILLAISPVRWPAT